MYLIFHLPISERGLVWGIGRFGVVNIWVEPVTLNGELITWHWAWFCCSFLVIFLKYTQKMLNMQICGTDAWMFWQYLLPAGVKCSSISLSKGFLLWSLITALSSTVFTTCFVNTAQSSEIRWFKACFRCWTFHVLNLMLIS